MAHAQKPHFLFRLNGRVHLNRRGSQFSRLLAAEVCASALVMMDKPRSEVVWEYWLPTPFAIFPFTSPPVRHRVPPHSERSIPQIMMWLRDFLGKSVRLWCRTSRQKCIAVPYAFHTLSHGGRPLYFYRVPTTGVHAVKRCGNFHIISWHCGRATMRAQYIRNVWSSAPLRVVWDQLTGRVHQFESFVR